MKNDEAKLRRQKWVEERNKKGKVRNRKMAGSPSEGEKQWRFW